MAEGEVAQEFVGGGGLAELSDAGRDAALGSLPFSLVITDPLKDDNPIVYVNRAFVATTGYSVAAAIGRNCRFLQGPETEKDQLAKLREAVANGDEITVELTNYRAEGTKFLNRLMIKPLLDEDGQTQLFLGIQIDQGATVGAEVAELQERLRELQHRVKNHLSLIVAMIRTHAADQHDDRVKFDILSSRVEALSLLYDQMMNPKAPELQLVSLGAYLSRVIATLQLLDDRKLLRVNVETDEVTTSFDAASRYGILLSELLTNALRHAFEGRKSGAISVRLWQEDCETHLMVRDDGIGLRGIDWPEKGGVGAKIVRELTDRLGGRLAVGKGPDGQGTEIRLSVPAD